MRLSHNQSTQTSAGRSGPQQSTDGRPVTGAEALSITGLAHSRRHHPALQDRQSDISGRAPTTQRGRSGCQKLAEFRNSVQSCLYYASPQILSANERTSSKQLDRTHETRFGLEQAPSVRKIVA